MKKRGVVGVITLLFTVTLLSALVQCDHDGMARVTIHIQNEAYAGNQDSIIDKFFNLFSTKAFAWSSDHGDGDGILTLTISGNNIATIVTTIPPTQSSYSTELPANNEITFRLTFYNSDSQFNTFGGQETVTLNMGDNDIPITILPMTEIIAFTYQPPGVDAGNLHVAWNSAGNGWGDLTATFGSYKLYTSDSQDGQFTLWKETALGDEGASDYDEEMPSLPSNMQYVKISITTDEWGEGLLSEAIPVEIL